MYFPPEVLFIPPSFKTWELELSLCASISFILCVIRPPIEKTKKIELIWTIIGTDLNHSTFS